MNHYNFESFNLDDNLAAQHHELPDIEPLDTSLDDSLTFQDDFGNNQNYSDAELNSAPDWSNFDSQPPTDGMYDRITDNLDVSSYDSSNDLADVNYGNEYDFATQTHELTNLDSSTVNSWDDSSVYSGDDSTHQSYLQNETNYSDSYSNPDYNYSYRQERVDLQVSAHENHDYYQDVAFGDSTLAEQANNASLHEQYLAQHQRSGSGEASTYLSNAQEQEGYATEHRNSQEYFSNIADDYRAEGKYDLANKYDDKAQTEQEWVETYQDKAQDFRDQAKEVG